ncbi:MAG: mannitol dehydrogenase family protein [Thermoflexales bacterium]
MNQPIEIRQGHLEALRRILPCPAYDRSRIRAGIVHIGVGGFHRSHEAFYTDALLAGPEAVNWGICGVGLREADRKIGSVLKKQDFLYTLMVKHPDGRIEPRIIGSIIAFLLSADDPQAVIDKMASPSTRIVSLTITEGGYNVDPASGEFDFSNHGIQHDLAHPQSPATVFGYLAAALRRRRLAGLAPFTILSCDNLQRNGDIARETLLAFAGRQDPELAKWIERDVAFPNAMVDRITPITGPEDIQYMAGLGVGDEWPVSCEPFRQWVIEDKFPNGRPAWEDVGAQFVADVTPFEKMKLRLLNAGHSVLGWLGALHGYATIDACMGDAVFAGVLKAFLDLEATPILDPVQGIDLEQYKQILIERFSNPNIRDSLTRICSESSAKITKFLVPTVTENLARNGSTRFAALVFAAWCYVCDKGVDGNGRPFAAADAMEAELHQAALGTSADPVAFLRLRSVFGDLADNPMFRDEYAKVVAEIYANPDIREDMQAAMIHPES